MSSTAQQYEPPDDDQLVNFVSVSTLGYIAKGTERELVKDFLTSPTARDIWLGRHRQMQEAAWAM